MRPAVSFGVTFGLLFRFSGFWADGIKKFNGYLLGRVEEAVEAGELLLLRALRPTQQADLPEVFFLPYLQTQNSCQ